MVWFGAIILAVLLGDTNAHATCQGLGDRDVRRVAEVQHVLGRYGSEVWPGWGGPTPWLLRSGACEYLIGHPTPPSGFEPVGRGPDGSTQIFAMLGHLTPGPVATTWPVADVWTIALPTLDELQGAIDAALGPGVVTLDDDSYVRAALHESFHVFQVRSVGGLGGIPRFGLDDERGAMLEVVGDAGFEAWLASQARQLTRALRAATVEDVTTEVRAFLDQRSTGRSERVVALGQALEWLEGSARYADTCIAALAAHAVGDPTAPAASPHQRALDDMLSQLDEIPSTLAVRDAYAALGAAQAFVLDRLDPGWKRSMFTEPRAFEALLQDAVAP